MSSSEERGSVFHTQGGAVFQNFTASRDININHITQIRPLADEINASFFDSPEIFNNVRNELIGLISAIGMAHTRHPDFLDDEDFPALEQELKDCRQTLMDLQRLKQRYDDLPSKSKFSWERTEMSVNSLAEMRARISSSRQNVTMLTTNMIACSQVNIERLLRKLLKEQSDEGSVLSSLSSGSLSLSDNEAWERIRKELQDIGMTPRAFDKNRTFILQFLEQAISEGDLIPGFEPGSQLEEAGSESIEPGSRAEKDREMTKLVTFTPTKRSNGLSRLVYRLTTSSNKFIQAAADGDLSLVMRSLGMNVDVDCHNGDGESALMKAASNGHEKIVEVLVAHGAAWKACSGMKEDCNTALCNAAAKGYTRIIELILEGGGTTDWCRGFSFSSRPYRPPSPLAVAASSGQLYAVQLLLEKGASVKTLYGSGESDALLSASANGHANIVRCLLEKGAPIDGLTPRGRTALSQAIIYQQDTMVTLLLSEGASVHVKDQELRTYLHLALAEQLDAEVKCSKQLAIVKSLLQYGAKETINAIDDKQNTPLLLAITQGASETVKLLMENGADINQRVENQVPPLLLYAAMRGSSAIVGILIEGGADVESINSLGDSALWEAVSVNDIRTAKILLENGADPNWKNHRGEPLIFHALRTLRSLSNPNRLDKLGAFDILLTSGANPNSIDQDGQTILIAAIHADLYLIIEMLLGYGADANLKDKANNTPFSVCLQARTSLAEVYSTCDLLKRYGATLG